jgi:hypothetical protein
MTTGNGAMNARAARKSLGDQIDRLDSILDGLAEALDGAVADAVRGVISHAVGEAVRAAVAEVLSSPELLRAALEKHDPQPAVPAAPPAPRPEPLTLKENVTRVGSRLYEKVGRAASLAREKLNAAARTTRTALAVAPFVLRAVARKVWAYRKPCAVAVGVGVVCATVCYAGGQLFSSIANGLSGAALAISAMTLPVKRFFAGGSR